MSAMSLNLSRTEPLLDTKCLVWSKKICRIDAFVCNGILCSNGVGHQTFDGSFHEEEEQACSRE
eukprot:7050084-Ditylum_brightwellii.AAC.1